jgi:hypothetical protein
VDEKTEQTNRLTSHLKIYFPQMLQWFEHLDTELVRALLERWPTLEELQKVSPAKLRSFFAKHHCRDQKRIEQRILAIHQSIPAIRDRAVIEVKSTVVKVMVQLIRTLHEGIADLDETIEEAAAAHPDFSIFESLPGAGPVLAPRLSAAFGSQRERYGNADEVQTYLGDRARDREEREKAVDPFSLGLPQVSAAEFSRMGKSLYPVLGMGAKLLPATAQQRLGPPCGRPSLGLQMDSYSVSL